LFPPKLHQTCFRKFAQNFNQPGETKPRTEKSLLKTSPDADRREECSGSNPQYRCRTRRV